MFNSVRWLPIVLLLLACSWPAEAQIYSWRDANGNLVLSDTLPRGAVRSYTTTRPDAPFRATRPAQAAFRGRYDDLISRYAATYDVSSDLVRAVVQVESGFNPFARSNKGAMGLMQLMPGTAVAMGVTNPFDPEQNIRGGVAYLRQLLNRYGNDVTLALAAYNSGPGTVDRYGYRVPYKETRNYISKVKSRSGGVGGTVSAAPAALQATATSVAPASPPARHIYKTVEIIDGRPVAKYTDARPASGPYEVVSRR